MRDLVSTRLVCTLVIALSWAGFVQAGDASSALRDPLPAVLAEASETELIPVSVVLKEQVTDVQRAQVRAGKKRIEARAGVLELLKRTAQSSQRPLLSRLRPLESLGRVDRIRPLWIGNVVGVDATRDVILEIAARPEVAWINYNPKVDVSIGARDESLDLPQGQQGHEVDAVECGVELMDTTRVWNEFGVTGEGALIAVIDSGVCWTHSDIANQVWVNPGEDIDGDGVVMDSSDMNGVDDDGNGFVDDLVGWNFDQGTNEPNDNDSHGSHVAGSVAGDGTDGTQSGMAPDAKIMILRVGLTFSDEVDVWNAMQYAADNGADAISMSLGWPPNQNPDRATWRNNCDNTIDAGTAMVIAAGNEGQGSEPNNLRTPGDVPRVITVGAVDCNDNAASFTSRGPVQWADHPYPPGLIKPDVSGPGVSTVSHNICNGYSTKSGTSMSTPHVAGAVALMLSGNPALEHDEIKQVLMDTSVDLGPAGMDNTFGQGRVDAYAAVDKVFGLSLEQVTVIDSDPNHANADGGVDTGELVTLELELLNNWSDRDATDIVAWVSTNTPGVTLVHDFLSWPDAGPQQFTTSDAPHLSLIVDQGCNYPIEMTLNMRYSDREASINFSVLVGTHFPRDLAVHDFETDSGWTPSGTSVTGQFERSDPNHVTNSNGDDVQPDDDVTPGAGTHAWVTGNADASPGMDDVDHGTSVLTSPAFDATDFSELSFDYSRFFYALPSTHPSTDYLRVQWARNGSGWANLEEVQSTENEWTARSLNLPPSAFGPDLQVRFVVEDDPIYPNESVVEGLIDDVRLGGLRVECDSFSAPSAQAPNPVGNTLLVTRDALDVRLDWTMPPTDASHDAATLFRIHRSDSPDGGFIEDGASTEPYHVEAGEVAAGTSVFFVVSSENGGGGSGEAP